MEKIINTDIKGFGKATIKEKELKGVWEDDNILEKEIDYYMEILDHLEKLPFIKE